METPNYMNALQTDSQMGGGNVAHENQAIRSAGIINYAMPLLDKPYKGEMGIEPLIPNRGDNILSGGNLLRTDHIQKTYTTGLDPMKPITTIRDYAGRIL
jgi:hypothetical protein